MSKTIYLKTDDLGYSYTVGIDGDDDIPESIYTGFDRARAAMINLINRIDREDSTDES